MANSISRRKLLLRTVHLTVGGALASAVAGEASAAACVDLKAMDAGEQSTRNELHWAASTPNPEQPCSKCGFFMSTSADCGNCMIFNGPTTPNGHCDSWAAKS
jgi:High potential iron-sulfur protein